MPGLVARLFDSFLTQAGADVATLGAAGEQEDGALVGQVCHRLRGAAATLGAVGVAGACEDLEAAVSAGKAPVDPDLLQRLEWEVALVALTVEGWTAG